MVAANYTWFYLKDAIVTTACTVFCILSMEGCTSSEQQLGQAPAATETPNGYSLDSVLDSLETRIRGASSTVGPQAEALHARTKEEWSKLFRWEYHVIDLPADSTAPDFQSKLDELGQEGWEVFSIIPRTEGIRVSCKRRPPSAVAYLKYVPGL
jgi:hypothetical protein